MRTWIALPVLLLSLIGCTSQNQAPGMAVGKGVAASMNYSHGFHDNMQVASVTVGKAANSGWGNNISPESFGVALMQSLSSASLLGTSNSGRYKVSARFVAAESVEYSVVDTSTGNVVFDTTITTPTAGNAVGAAAGRENEASVRENIRLFLKGLSQKVL